MSVRDVFLEVSALLVDAVAQPGLADRWDAPSALDQMTVGLLAAHAVGAVINVEMCLAGADAAGVAGDGEPESIWADDAADYYVRVKVMSGYGGIESPGQAQIRDGSSAFAALGAEIVAQTGADCLERLRPRLAEPIDEPVHVFGGMQMELDPYLETRVAEIAVHLDDLAASPELADVPIGAPSAEAWTVTADLFAALAIREHGPQAVVNTLIRPERAPADITVL